MNPFSFRIPPSLISPLFTVALVTTGCAQGPDGIAPSNAVGDSQGTDTDGIDTDDTDAGGTDTGDSGGSSSTGAPDPVCGDGVVEGDEACDDGNLDDGDGCESDCTYTIACGDGLYVPGEICHSMGLSADVGNSASAVVIADLDADGDLDLVASMPDDKKVLRLLFEQGAPADEAEFPTPGTPDRLLAISKGPGDAPDLFSGTIYGPPLLAYDRLENTGNAFFWPGTPLPFYGAPIVFGNFSGGTGLDAISVVPAQNACGNTATTYKNLETSLQNPAISWCWNPETPSAALPADVNGDGRDDLVAVLPGTQTLQLQVMGPGGVPITSMDLSMTAVSDRFAAADVSGDGTPDVLALPLNESKVMVLALTPTPEVDSVAYVETPDPLVDVAAGDFDGDGLIDLVAASQTQELLFLRAKAPMDWELAHTIVLGDVPSQIAVGDLNEDGRDDVAVALAGFGEVRVALSQP